MKAVFTALLALSMYSAYSQTVGWVCGNQDPEDAEINERRLAIKATEEVTANKLKNTRFPEFAYENINGELVKSDTFNNKYLYITIWATYCEACKSEIKYRKKILENYRDKNIEFVNISIDGTEHRSNIKNLLSKDSRYKDFNGIELFAERNLKSDFMAAMEIISIPRFILISPDGKIIDASAKRLSDPALQAQLDTLLK